MNQHCLLVYMLFVWKRLSISINESIHLFMDFDELFQGVLADYQSVQEYVCDGTITVDEIEIMLHEMSEAHFADEGYTYNEVFTRLVQAEMRVIRVISKMQRCWEVIMSVLPPLIERGLRLV